jgi:hypothetical protein
MRKLINITAPQHRCSLGACPAVYKFDGDKFYGIIGKVVDDPDLADRIGEGEAAVEIPAEILLSSLGVTDLIEAAERSDQLIADLGSLMISYLTRGMEKDAFVSEVIGRLDEPDPYVSLRSVIDRIKGGAA